MNQYYSVWADGENFRPMISQNEEDIARRLYDATSLASLEPLELSPKDIQEELDEEAEINPVNAEAIVKARYERGYADCIYVWPDIGPVLILSQRAVDRIGTIVGNDGEYFRFDVDGTTVYLFHCTKVLNCLDVDRSEIICHSNGVSERLKGASARRFKRGQFDRKGMVHSDSGFLRKPSTGVGTWYVVWIWTKRRELSSYSLQG
ncbi:MAG: hypothetical protein NTY15_00995 [Planctomycetota bacterium]|nr:hypothetical protein [Planctomycetota bacterium]